MSNKGRNRLPLNNEQGDLNALLGIDMSDPLDRLADALVSADERFMADLMSLAFPSQQDWITLAQKNTSWEYPLNPRLSEIRAFAIEHGLGYGHSLHLGEDDTVVHKSVNPIRHDQDLELVDKDLLVLVDSLREINGITREQMASCFGTSEEVLLQVPLNDIHLSTLRRYVLSAGGRYTHFVYSLQKSKILR